jgi:segregation and condensation protein B
MSEDREAERARRAETHVAEGQRADAHEAERARRAETHQHSDHQQHREAMSDDEIIDVVDVTDQGTVEMAHVIDLTDGADAVHGEAERARRAEPDQHDVVRAFEAMVMVAVEPVDPQLLAEILAVPIARVEQIAAELAAQYEADGRGFQLAKVAGGFRFQSHPACASYVERFVLDGQSSRLSAAALETLAIVAYKQPISRAQIAAIRGVDPDAVLRTLHQRGYVAPIGNDPGPGQAVLWGTTSVFLERLGLESVDALPPIAEFVPGADVLEALEHGLRIDSPA